MKAQFLLVLLFCGSFLFSCQGDEVFKQPTQVGFAMDINREAGMGDRLQFDQGSIILASFDFEGQRVQGDDVFFSREYEQGLLIPFDPNNVIAELDFQIPQGSYTRISVSFSTFDDFGDNSILVEGSYRNSNDTTYPVRFEFISSEFFEAVAEDDSGNNEIILKKETPVNAEIKLDPISWFQAVPQVLMDDADLIEINGSPTILVNEDENTNIFEIIVARLDEATETIFR